jgi:hypothetical protein
MKTKVAASSVHFIIKAPAGTCLRTYLGAGDLSLRWQLRAI